MAEGQTRIIDQTTDLALEDGDYILVDSLDEGTRKFNLGEYIESVGESVSELSNKIGDTTMGTTATTITGAIAEHEGDISSLNSNLSGVKMFAMDVSSSRTFFVSDSYRGMLIITDSSLSRSGIYLVGVTGTGACSVKAVSIPDDTVITTGTNSLAINPTIGSRRILFITLAGTVS